MVGFGILLNDVDRDGYLDMLVANGHILDNIHLVQPQYHYEEPNQLLLGDGLGDFVDVSGTEPAFARKTVSRGIASGDLDGDGDLDFVFTNNGGPPQVLSGNLTGGRWLALRLEGPRGNTQGLGASVWFEHTDGSRTLHRMESARSYASSCDPVIHVGTPVPIAAVEILWPGGVRERWDALDDFEGHRTLAHGSGSTPDG